MSDSAHQRSSHWILISARRQRGKSEGISYAHTSTANHNLGSGPTMHHTICSCRLWPLRLCRDGPNYPPLPLLLLHSCELRELPAAGGLVRSLAHAVMAINHRTHNTFGLGWKGKRNAPFNAGIRTCATKTRPPYALGLCSCHSCQGTYQGILMMRCMRTVHGSIEIDAARIIFFLNR